MNGEAGRRRPRLGSFGVLIPACLLTSACGYIGPPLPPALNLPNRVTDLTAAQRGSNLVIHFTMSRMTTEALPIKDPPEVDLRVGVSGTRFDLPQWLANAVRVQASQGAASYQLPTAGFAGKNVVVAVRLLNDRGRDAGWSNFVALAIAEPIARPERLSARATANGVELAWLGDSAPLYRIYRKGETGEFAPLADAPKSPYVDTTAEFGKSYTYFVQGVRKSGDTASESEASESVTITPKDTFPPTVPSHLSAIAGTRSVELSWDRDTEPDLAGYHLFRGASDGSLQPIGGNLPSANYSDRAVPSGRYRYAVSAFDLLGNESPRSPSIEVIVP